MAKDDGLTPIFAINNEAGQVLGLLTNHNGGFAIVASHLANPNPLAVQLWTRAELVAIRNQINKALHERA